MLICSKVSILHAPQSDCGSVIFHLPWREPRGVPADNPFRLRQRDDGRLAHAAGIAGGKNGVGL